MAPARVPVAVWTVWGGEDLVGCKPTRSRRARPPPCSSGTSPAQGCAGSGLPAATGVYRATAHPPVPPRDNAATGPIARTLGPTRPARAGCALVATGTAVPVAGAQVSVQSDRSRQ